MQNLIPRVPMRSLSIGNVVTAALRLYLSRLKLYFRLALFACLWLIIPIYGWAKFSAILAMISRLIFSDLIGQPEPTKATRKYTTSRPWRFLITGIVVNIFTLILFVILSVIELFFLGMVGIFIQSLTSRDTFLTGAIALIAFIITLLSFFAGTAWIYSRFCVTELPLAVENNIDSINTISRSWSLTKGWKSASRIQGIFIVAFLISLPIQILSQILIYVGELGLNSLIKQNASLYSNSADLLTLGLVILTSGLFIPFWQAIKAVLYYDLRSRREGFGLQLRRGDVDETTAPTGIFNSIALQTPESVELEFTLAGIGSRAWALLIDYLVLGAILVVFLILWSALWVQLVDYFRTLFGYYQAGQVGQWLFAIAILIMFFIYTGYFVFFETLWQGQTPGKRVAKIRVIRDDGRPVGLQQATLRSLLRPFDDSFFLFLGAFLIMFGRREKRLGDWAAGTIAIQVSPAATTFALSTQSESVSQQLLSADFSQMLPDDFAVVREYLQRRRAMLPQARTQLSLQLEQEVKNAIAHPELPPITSDVFLEAVYLAYQKRFVGAG